MRCGRTLIVAPGAARMCHLPANHDGSHEVIYLETPVKWRQTRKQPRDEAK